MADSRWRVAVVADARVAAGLGHIARCHVLAHALVGEGAEVAFFLSEPSDAARQRLQGFTVIEGEPKTAVPIWEPAQIVLDHYGLSGDVFPALRSRGVRLLVLEDAPTRRWEADWVLDPAAGPQEAEAYRTQAPGARVLAGGAFALVDPAYAQAASLPRPVHERLHVAIAMGGTDPAGATVAALRALLPHRQLLEAIDVVLGPGYPNPETLTPLLEALDAQAHQAPPSLLPWLEKADLMLGAGGSTHWERATLGVPAAVVTLAPNQRPLTERLAADGALLDLGQAPGDWEAAVGLLVSNPPLRAAMRRRLQAWTDGRGARRVALEMRNARLKLRPAAAEDASMMFAWRNAPETRRFSRDASSLVWEDHQAWLSRSLAHPDRQLFVGELDERPCGVLRYERDAAGMVEVSIYLDPARHGQALGPALLRAGVEAIRALWPATQRIDAFILAENRASEQAFAAAGFVRRHGVWSLEEPA